MEYAAVATTTQIKALGYLSLIFLFEFFRIDTLQFVILLALLAADVISGGLRELIISPSTFSSRIGLVGILGKVLIIGIPAVFALVLKGVGIDGDLMLRVILSLLIAYEGYSFLANVGQIRAKDKTIGEYDAVTALIQYLQDYLKRFVSALIPKK